MMASALAAWDADSAVDSDSSELISGSERRLSGGWVKRGAFSALALALAATGACYAAQRTPRQFSAVATVDKPGFMQLEEEDPCAAFQYLNLKKVIYKNLGNKGPDTGNGEGLVYEADLVAPHETSKTPLLVTVNATNDDYKPNQAKEVGFSGKFGSFNVKGGSKVHLMFHFVDPKTLKPMSLDKQSITFFDLDTHSNGESVEYVKFKGFKGHTLTKSTQIDVAMDDEGFYIFKATQVGTGNDNPTDPMKLTTDQKDKAVTVEFDHSEGFEAEFGCSQGSSPRYFNWIGRPSLKCVGGGDDLDTVTVAPTTTKPEETTTTTVATTTAEEKKCWFTIPIINFCFPKLF